MLKLVKNPEFTAPVTVQVPTESGQIEHSFKARFRALTRSEEAEYDALSASSTDEFMRRVLVGWDGLQDENGKDLKFSPEAVSLLLDLHYIRQALIVAYTSVLAGKNPKRGN